MSGRGRPKFWVGQYVVARRPNESFSIVKLVKNRPYRDGEWFMCSDGYSRHSSRFRPLTAREIGPRKARKKP